MLRSPSSLLVFILDFCRLAGRSLLRGHALRGIHGRFVACPLGLRFDADQGRRARGVLL